MHSAPQDANCSTPPTATRVPRPRLACRSSALSGFDADAIELGNGIGSTSDGSAPPETLHKGQSSRLPLRHHCASPRDRFRHGGGWRGSPSAGRGGSAGWGSDGRKCDCRFGRDSRSRLLDRRALSYRPGATVSGGVGLGESCLVAARPILSGETILAEIIAARRPAVGLSPVLHWDLLGPVAMRDYDADKTLELP